MSNPTQPIDPDKLTDELLSRIFKAASLKPALESDNTVCVKGSSGLEHDVFPAEANLYFETSVDFPDNINHQDRLDFAHRTTMKKDLIKCVLTDDHDPLMLRYELPKYLGLTPEGIIKLFFRYDLIVSEVISELAEMSHGKEYGGPGEHEKAVEQERLSIALESLSSNFGQVAHDEFQYYDRIAAWDDISIETLYDIFEMVGLQPEIDVDDGDLIVAAHVSGTLYVERTDEIEAIGFYKFGHLRSDVDRDEVLSILKTVQELEDLRCSPVGDNGILASYLVGRSDGWTPRDIVDTFHEVDVKVGIFREQIAPFAIEQTLSPGYDRLFNMWRETIDTPPFDTTPHPLLDSPHVL